jgi:hypothetical protein
LEELLSLWDPFTLELFGAYLSHRVLIEPINMPIFLLGDVDGAQFLVEMSGRIPGQNKPIRLGTIHVNPSLQIKRKGKSITHE